MTTNSPSPTLAEALVLYRVAYLAGHGLAPLSRDAYVRDIVDLVTWLEDAQAPNLLVPVDTVTRDDLERYLVHLDARGLAVAYRRRKVAALRSFFGFLQDWGLLPISPADDLVPPAKEDPHLRVLTEAECTRLLAAVRHEPRDRAIIVMLLQTGLRLSELSRLRLDDVVLKPGNVGAITVQGTGPTQRTLTLPAEACAAVATYLTVRPDDAEDNRLFVTRFHRGIGPRAIERVVEKYLAEARIARASVQSLRHTYAMHQLRRGVALDLLRQTLGHGLLATTRRYVS
jgi:site-specific recombinase XerD